MSPGLVPAARLLIEGAVAHGTIPATAGYQLINTLSPDQPPLAKTLMRRDLPGGAPTTANDKTILMAGNNQLTSVERTEAISKATPTIANDATVLTSRAPLPESTVAIHPRPTPKVDATELLDKKHERDTPVDATVTIAHGTAVPPEATRVLESRTAHRTEQVSPPTTERTQRIPPLEAAASSAAVMRRFLLTIELLL